MRRGPAAYRGPSCASVEVPGERSGWGWGRPDANLAICPLLPYAPPPSLPAGYVIPTSVVRHFLADYEHSGAYAGFPSLVGDSAALRLAWKAVDVPACCRQPGLSKQKGGPAGGVMAPAGPPAPLMPLPPLHSAPLLQQNIVWQEMDSKALKRAYNMQTHQKGVLVGGHRHAAGGWWVRAAYMRLRPTAARLHSQPVQMPQHQCSLSNPAHPPQPKQVRSVTEASDEAGTLRPDDILLAIDSEHGVVVVGWCVVGLGCVGGFSWLTLHPDYILLPIDGERECGYP